MRLTHKELSLAIAILIAGIGLIIIQPASAATTKFSSPFHSTPKTCYHGCSWTIGGITYTVPNRIVEVAPTTTTTLPPVTTTTVKPYVAPQVASQPPAITTTTIAPTPVNGNPYGVTAADVAAWTKVAVCEEGGNWHVRGGMYSGGLGISNTNWAYYSRGMGVPASAADATPIQQIAVAKKINAGYQVPDQYGCAAW